jgi:hypothetical protein
MRNDRAAEAAGTAAEGQLSLSLALSRLITDGGKLVEVWHSEDAPGMLRQLRLEPPPAILRFAAKRSARRYRRERAGANV